MRYQNNKTIDTGTWNITKGTPFEYDTGNGQTPVLAQIDGSDYLCVYDGVQDDGWAVVLNIISSSLRP